jgi:hypothetical protein
MPSANDDGSASPHIFIHDSPEMIRSSKIKKLNLEAVTSSFVANFLSKRATISATV